MTRSTKITLLVIVVATLAAGAYVYLRSAHTRLAAQYNQLLAEFSSSPSTCPSRTEQGSGADLYARAFERLQASPRELELWNSGDMKGLDKLTPAEAPLYHLWQSLGGIFVANPVTAAAPAEVLQCLGIESPRLVTDTVVRNLQLDFCRQFVSLKPALEEVASAAKRRDCASPYAPTNAWAKDGKPMYGFTTLVNANRLQAHLMDLAGKPEEASQVRLITIKMLLDLQRDATLVEFALTEPYLHRELTDFGAAAPGSNSESLRAELEAIDREWPSFQRIQQAEALWTLPAVIFPGVAITPSARSKESEPFEPESVLLWFAAPEYLNFNAELTRATDSPRLLDSIALRNELAGKFHSKSFFLPMLTSEIESAGYEGYWRENHALVRLLRLRVAGETAATLLRNLKDPLTGEGFRGNAGQFSSAATGEAFRKTVAEKASRYLAKELTSLTVSR